MKIGDRDNFTETATHELMEGVTVTINGLPLGFDEQMEEDIPSPVAPRIPMRNKDGQKVYKNKQKKILETVPDEDNPEFKAKTKVANRRQAAWLVYNGTLHGGSIKWTAVKDSFDDPADFYHAIYDEIIASGAGAGKVLQISHAIQAISGMNKKQIERAKDAFLSEEVSET